MTRSGLIAVLIASFAASAAAQRGPARSATHVPADVLALVCAPKAVYEMPAHPLRVTGGQDDVERRIYSPGDLVTINAGTDNGIEVGQEYFVRRVLGEYRRYTSRNVPGNIRTAGWIRIYAVDKEMSLATITYACDTIEVGDYLEPLVLPVVPATQAEAPGPQHSNYAHIVFGTDRRRSVGKGEFFVIDHGSDHGVSVGSLFVVYHDKQLPGNFLYEVGEAVAVEVGPETSTLQVTLSRSAFGASDYVAIRK